MCLRYPQATLPTGSILPPPLPPPTWLYTIPNMVVYYPPPQKQKKKTTKTWLTNFFDSTVSVYFRNLLTLIMSVERRTMAVF